MYRGLFCHVYRIIYRKVKQTCNCGRVTACLLVFGCYESELRLDFYVLGYLCSRPHQVFLSHHQMSQGQGSNERTIGLLFLHFCY